MQRIPHINVRASMNIQTLRTKAYMVIRELFIQYYGVLVTFRYVCTFIDNKLIVIHFNPLQRSNLQNLSKIYFRIVGFSFHFERWYV